MKLLLITYFLIIKLSVLHAWGKCGIGKKSCINRQICFKTTNNENECRPRCPKGWNCELINFDLIINSSPNKCGLECPMGLKCIEEDKDIFKCAVANKKSNNLLSKSFSTENVFVPLITPQEFIEAVTSAGYQEPSIEKYHYLVTQAGLSGGISSKRELAMFLAQILWESDGLKAKKEYACADSDGCVGMYRSQDDYPGQQYYGRGYIQLTWSGNYKAASNDLFNDDRLLRNPDLVSDNEEVAWATTFWYWKTMVRVRPGIEKGEFGVATDSINGLLECKGPNVDKAKHRFELYVKILKALKINETPIESGCY